MAFDFLTIVVYPTTDFAPRCMTKKEYAKRAGIKERTLRNYLNNIYFPELEKMGYSREQRKLSINIVAYLDKKLVVTPNEEH
jgi:hypothetical protein